MIGQIRGALVAKNPPEILVDVQGITYELQVPMSTLYRLPGVGEQVVLHTHFAVREDAQVLYGFFEQKDKSMFRALIKVSGVGPKMALGILSGMNADEIVRTVQANDINLMTTMPGIGKKTAERLMVEMRDRLADWVPADVPGAATGGETTASPGSINRDAETALIALGYKPQQAARAVSQAMKENPALADSESLIRDSLKIMAQ